MKILVADPEFNVRYGLRALLEEQFDLEIVGDVATAEALHARILKSCPDLLLLSWEFPGVVAGELIAQIRNACPNITIFVMSVRVEEKQGASLVGADAFINKADSPGKLLARIQAIYQERGFD